MVRRAAGRDGARRSHDHPQPDTRAVAELFNQCYEVMLLLLLYLYSDQVKTEEQTNASHGRGVLPVHDHVRPAAGGDPHRAAGVSRTGGRPPKNFETAGPGFELAGDVVLFPTCRRPGTCSRSASTRWSRFRQLTARRPLPPPRQRLRSMGVDPVNRSGAGCRWHDPWLKLPSQTVRGSASPNREELWKSSSRKATTIWPEERDANIDAWQ